MSQHCCGPKCNRTLNCECDCIGCDPQSVEEYTEMLETENLRLTSVVKELEKTLTIVQERCTKQLFELRSFKASKALPGLGWDCGVCGAFNGSMKEELSACRCCDAPRQR
jgi:hypothetical protein